MKAQNNGGARFADSSVGQIWLFVTSTGGEVTPLPPEMKNVTATLDVEVALEEPCSKLFRGNTKRCALLLTIRPIEGAFDSPARELCSLPVRILRRSLLRLLPAACIRN